MRGTGRFIGAALFIMAVAVWLDFLSGCSAVGTVVPQAVAAREIAWDGNDRDAGLLDGGRPLPALPWQAAGDFHISATARARYNALIGAGYGRLMLPAIGTDYGVLPFDGTTFRMTHEAMDYFYAMMERRRSGQPAPQ